MRSRSRRPMARIGSESSALTKAPPATHLEELRAWMASQDLTAAYITQPVSIAYLTGVLADPEALRERLHTRAMVYVAPEIRRLRRTKSRLELEKLAHAAAITDAATD